jgi:putative transposase
MARQPRQLVSGFCYHVTTRCNNREFCLYRRECREVFIYVIKQATEKFRFKLYGLCIMSNHIHYLIEPDQPEDLPKIMQWINWYTAMCFNRMLNRVGHFWEKRYHCVGFDRTDHQRVLNTLRYIHANPRAAKMQQGFFYDFSNYGTYDQLTQDGVTEWHPAFLKLAENLEDCAKQYRNFCHRYKAQPKAEKRSSWGSKLLKERIPTKGKPSNIRHKTSPGQLVLPELDGCQVSETSEVQTVAGKFVAANAYPKRT